MTRERVGHWSLSLLFALTFGIWTYRCTRGADGEPVAAVAGFAGLAIVYCLAMLRSPSPRLRTAVSHLFLFAMAVVGALLIDPQLDGMGGILNMLLPASVPLIVLAGLAARWLARDRRAHGS